MVETGKSKNRILVVDDMLVHREMVSRLLDKEKYSVILAENGQEALDILTSEKIDLVLLDIEMPEMNGFEVCELMRKDENLKEIPVIFVTSNGKIENKISGFGIGAQDFVTKPFNSRELLVRINTHLLLKRKSDVIRNMNKVLEEKNKDITQSIEYSRYIQQALLPPIRNLDKLIVEKFLIYKSKEIIGGDFYWFKQCASKLYIVVADCTGHGVPGALMSVLGISILNDVMNEYFNMPPADVLNKLRQRVIRALHQKDKAFYPNDGMDMAMCFIDFETMKLQYAGANIPLFLVKHKEAGSDVEIIKCAPDRLPIGNHPNVKNSFTNRQFDLSENDRVYLFTDGYISQFGGESHKTFKTWRLVELLKEVQHLNMKQQKLFIESSMLTWKGLNDQVDDILALGLQIKKYRFI